ncbi:cytochrome P450 [Striga asiatica]|uniref:Cytochrome P450 n=1 Tax=Striga asiatica TaxID=4170 RepID=A0A5A7RHW1_STRAF|nr:cytochrome P450 [Striga asiatica]
MAFVHSLIIPLFITLIMFIIFLKKWRSSFHTAQKNTPPSPKGLPLIGNIHQLGTSAHRSLQSLSRQYGHELLLLHLGRVPVLLASSAKAAREIMKNQDAIFSNRPKLTIPNRLLYGSRDMAFTPYGEYWRQVRSICVANLLSSKRVQSFRRVRKEETSAMLNKIGQLASSSSSSVINLSNVFASLSSDILCRVVLGRKYSNENREEYEKFKVLGEFAELLGAISWGDYIPWLSWINRVNGLNAKVERVAKQYDSFLENVIQEHKENEGRKHDDDDGELDFVDILLELQRKNENGFLVEDETIKALILDMFGAGTDTTELTLVWVLTELIKNPRTTKILQNEVKNIAENKKGIIDESDLDKMPYLKATIKESLRLHTPVPLLIPRECTHDTKVMGYDVLAGTQVLINAWAIARDPKSWENPEEFRPERFLDSGVDFRGKDFEFIPFGAGRRGCPGTSFAVAVVELGLAKLVHSFEFALPDGEKEEDLDMSETEGLTLHKRLPLLVVATPFDR